MPATEAFVPQGQASLSYDEYSSAIASLTNIEFSGSTSEVDYTNNDSPGNVNEFKPGNRDMGTITADFIANSSNAEALHDLWVARTIDTFQITYWDSGFSKTVTGFVSEFSVSGELRGESVVEGSLTIRITSEVA